MDSEKKYFSLCEIFKDLYPANIKLPVIPVCCVYLPCGGVETGHSVVFRTAFRPRDLKM